MSELQLQDLKGEILKFEPDGKTLVSIATMHDWDRPESKIIAKELVRRWNAFPDLLAASKAQEEADNWFGPSDTGRKLKDKAKELRIAAIAKAKP